MFSYALDYLVNGGATLEQRLEWVILVLDEEAC
jgi:hypothetical protein